MSKKNPTPLTGCKKFTSRNHDIFQRYVAGESLQSLAEMNRISPARISQIAYAEARRWRSKYLKYWVSEPHRWTEMPIGSLGKLPAKVLRACRNYGYINYGQLNEVKISQMLNSKRLDKKSCSELLSHYLHIKCHSDLCELSFPFRNLLLK